METILVPTDFSKNAENALLYAVDLAKKEGAKIILLHACRVDLNNSDIPFFDIGEQLVKTQRDSKKQLNVLANEHIEKQGVAFEIRIIDQFALEAIDILLEEFQIDLIIMGTKGASGIIGSIFGSNTAKVIEKVTCPVLAIPEAATFHTIKKITFATAYNQSDVKALEKVIEIAKPYAAHLRLLHISDGAISSQEELSLMEKFIESAKLKSLYDNMSFQIIANSETEKALLNYIADSSIDMLVMSTHHRSFFDKIFGKSYTQHIAFHTKIPLLAFHQN